jgi:deoxyadenosine/deoxycytidine kinase
MPVSQKVKAIISIEAPIGAGKSTVLKHVSQEIPDLCIVDEPVEEWNKLGLLAAMYNNEVHRGLFQATALSSRVGVLSQALRDNDVVLSERSPWSDKVFARANLAPGSWDEKCYNLCFKNTMNLLPDVVWYQIQLTNVSPLELEARVNERARAAETRAGAIPREYQSKLIELHAQLATSPLAARTVCVDASANKAVVGALVVEEVRRILEEGA